MTDDPLVGRWVRGDGGAYDITPSGSGFTGTVAVEWRSGTGPCVHRVGQAIWVNIAAQGGGKYTGTNHGFSWTGNDPASCTDLPQTLTITLTGPNSLNYCVADQGCADLTRNPPAPTTSTTTTSATTARTTTSPPKPRPNVSLTLDGAKVVHWRPPKAIRAISFGPARGRYHVYVVNHGPGPVTGVYLTVSWADGKSTPVEPRVLVDGAPFRCEPDGLPIAAFHRTTCRLASMQAGASRLVNITIYWDVDNPGLSEDEAVALAETGEFRVFADVKVNEPERDGPLPGDPDNHGKVYTEFEKEA